MSLLLDRSGRALELSSLHIRSALIAVFPALFPHHNHDMDKRKKGGPGVEIENPTPGIRSQIKTSVPSNGNRIPHSIDPIRMLARLGIWTIAGIRCMPEMCRYRFQANRRVELCLLGLSSASRSQVNYTNVPLSWNPPPV